MRPAPSPWAPGGERRAAGTRSPLVLASPRRTCGPMVDRRARNSSSAGSWPVTTHRAPRPLIRLLPSADELLPGLETLAARGMKSERARLLESIQVLTRRGLRLQRGEACPKLSALVARPVERGRGLVGPWVEATAADELIKEFQSSLCGTEQLPGAAGSSSRRAAPAAAGRALGSRRAGTSSHRANAVLSLRSRAAPGDRAGGGAGPASGLRDAGAASEGCQPRSS